MGLPLRSSLATFGLLPLVCFAAEIGGGIRVGASHTDNVFLVTSPDEVDDIVYQATPFLNITHESPQLDADVNYTFDWYRYADLKATSKYHRGAASLKGKAWDDSLTAVLGIQRSQILSDPEEVIPAGRLPLTDNIIDADEWWFSPRLNRTLGRSVNLDTDYRYSRLTFDEGRAQDRTNQTGKISLENYGVGQGLTWALRYEWSRTDFELSAPWEYQQASAELGTWVNSKTRLFGAGGKESAWDDPVDPTLADPFWEAGFATSASENLSAEFAVGERGFGPSWRGMLDYTFRRGKTSLSYSESPTTVGRLRGLRGGATKEELNPDDFDDFLDNPSSAERYISKWFQWDLNLEFRRTEFSLAAFNEDRSGRITANGTPLDDQSQTGVRAHFSWHAGVRTEFAAAGSFVDRETGVGKKSELASAQLEIIYGLGTRSDLSLRYRYTDQHPSGDDLSGPDYIANVVSVFFTYSM